MSENTPPLDLGELMRMHAQTATAWVISTGYRGFDPGYVIFDGSERGRVVLQSARMGASREQFLADVQFAATAHTMMPALLARLAAAEHERDTLAAQVQTLREALEQIQQWAEAYPMTVFREISPEGMKRVATILHEANISMDALHAGWARQIMQGIGQITAAALAPPQGEEA